MPMVGLVDAAIAHGFAGEVIRSYFEHHAGVAETLARLRALAGAPLAGNPPGA